MFTICINNLENALAYAIFTDGTPYKYEPSGNTRALQL